MQQKLKSLLAWFEPADAAAALMGHLIAEPGEDVHRHKALYEEKKRAMLARAPYIEQQPDIEFLPVDLSDAGKASLNSFFGEDHHLDAERYRIVILDLRKILAFQKSVMLDRPDPRIATVDASDMRTLFDICLPPESHREELDGTLDHDGKALTITSSNPNLRLASMQRLEFPPGSGTQMIGFPIVYGAAYMQVVEYKGRYVLKNGYHRAYALLERGITRVPVVLQTGRSFKDVYRGTSSYVAFEHLVGTHPPQLVDFHDPTVSATVYQRAFRKVVRIQAEEFIVNI